MNSIIDKCSHLTSKGLYSQSIAEGLQALSDFDDCPEEYRSSFEQEATCFELLRQVLIACYYLQDTKSASIALQSASYHISSRAFRQTAVSGLNHLLESLELDGDKYLASEMRILVSKHLA